MEELELAIFVLGTTTVALAVLSRVVGVPYPILLVLGGLALGLVPGAPHIELDPEVVLIIFLPPLLYGAAFFTSLRDLRASARPISLLAIGLVLFTMASVGVAAHYVVGMPWAVAFTLGAIVAPTDPVAPAEILRRLGVPRRLLTVIEGESLINDWTALILYKFAVAAVVTGAFSIWEAGPEFFLVGIGGAVVGLVAGKVIREVRRRIDDPPTEITLSIVSAYIAYLPAEALGVSGVIAAVTVGIYMGWYTPELTNAVMRIQGVAVWEVMTFLVNAVLFLLIGLQLPQVLEQLEGRPTLDLIGWALLIWAVVVGTRMLWLHSVVYLIRLVDRRPSQVTRRTSWRFRLVGAWSGVRGAVSLAAALAVPLSTDAGAAFPERDLVIFLAFSVIVLGLVVQGLTLPPLIRWAGIEDDGLEEREEIQARQRAAEAAVGRIEELAVEEWVRDDTADRVRGMYDYRRRRFVALADGDDRDGYEERARNYQRLLRELFDTQRSELVRMRNAGEISDEVRRRIERDIDLEETRLED